MRARTQQRKKIKRYADWLARNHPRSAVPPCVIREHNRWVAKTMRNQIKKEFEQIQDIERQLAKEEG